MPLTFWSFMIGSAALSALPFTSGFYSKHEILLAAFEVSPVLWAAGCLGALITGIYSFRLVFVVFFGVQSEVVEKSLGWRMSVPLFLLGYVWHCLAACYKFLWVRYFRLYQAQTVISLLIQCRPLRLPRLFLAC